MKLIFGALAIVTTIAVLLAGVGAFWVSGSALEQSKQASVKALATGLAYSISVQMLLFEKTVAQIAADSDVVTAVESANASLMENTANKLQKFLPVALKIRVLPATVNAIDERETPVLGYADLEMVRKTLTAKQPAIIQGEGANRHLALTAPIKKGDQVIGVVLASLKYDFLNEILTKAPIQEDFIEIMQDSVELSSGGNPAAKANNPQQLTIANSPWQISYAAASAHSLLDISMIMGILTSLAALVCVALFFGYFYVAALLKKDQNTILEAVKNLMTGKDLGTYDIKLTEMQVILSTLVQFKRIIDNKSGKIEEPSRRRASPKDISLDEIDDFEDDGNSSLIKSVSRMLKKKK